jgi:hypothetical protein
MALIAPNHPAANQTREEFWRHELQNCQTLLFELEKAIYNLSKTEIKSYTLDTGQSVETVTRQDLPSLLQQMQSLRQQISEIEDMLGISVSAGGSQCIQVAPF